MANDEWLRVNEYYDVLASTDLLAILAPRLKKHPRDWKWMILAAQNGMQGAIVCAIQDSSVTNVLTKNSAKETLNWYDTRQGDYPAQQLADFKTLLKKFKRKYPEILSAEHYRRAIKLHLTFRNQFAHFLPASWSIRIDMLPQLALAAIDLIELAMRQDQVLMRSNGNFRRQLAGNLGQARSSLEG